MDERRSNVTPNLYDSGLRLEWPELLRRSLWFGILTALGQTALVLLARAFTRRLIHITNDIVWVGPVANVALYTILGVILYAFTRRTPLRTASALVSGVFLFTGVIGVLLQVPGLHPYAAFALAAGLSVEGGRQSSRHANALAGLVRTTLPWLAALSVALAAGYPAWQAVSARAWEAAPTTAPAGAPNVLLIVLDTVRASSLDLHGATRATAPRLRTFAQSGVVFDNALSTAPWTLPSHASMFTGRLPKDVSADWQTPLDGQHTTLADALRSRGYATVANVANLLYATTPTGLNRGFTRYWDFPVALPTFMQQSWLVRPVVMQARSRLDETDLMVRKSGAEVTDRFLAWVGERPQRPFFAFLNYFDAHAPYVPPPPYDTMFGKGGPMPDVLRRRQWSPDEIQRSLDAYEGSIAFMDAQLGRLFDELKRQGVLDNTIVIVTSDHGEQFGEHGLFDHANSLYRAVLHVPLVISYPGRVPAGLTVETPVSLVDLASTVLDLTGTASGAPAPLPGRTLASHWDGAPPAAGTPVFAEVSQGINTAAWLPVSRGRMTSVVMNGWHYIRNGDGTEELYDFAHDPAEAENRATDTSVAGALEAARAAVVTTLARP